MTLQSLLTKLSSEFAIELDARFRRLRDLHPTETFYGIATCHETDTFSCYFSAHSREAIQRELHSRSSQSGTPVDQLSSSLYFIPSWEFGDDKAFAFALHQRIWTISEESGEDWRLTCKKVFDAYVEGLRLFETHGGLSDFDRNEFALIPWVNDPDDEGTWVVEAVEKLNPSGIANGFRREYGYA
jgi:hypothetical protein